MYFVSFILVYDPIEVPNLINLSVDVNLNVIISKLKNN